MAPKRYATITITSAEAFLSRSFIDDNPVISALRKLPHIGRHAQMFDSGTFMYAVKTVKKEIIVLPVEVRLWLYNYLRCDIVAPLQFKVELPSDVKEDMKVAFAYKKLKQFPTARRGEPTHKSIVRRRKSSKKSKKILDKEQ